MSKVGAAALLLASTVLAAPAWAHPGDHDSMSARDLVAHFLGEGFHVGHIVALVGLALAGLGLWSVIRSARGGFRR
jgi:hypothetical protein